MVRGTYLPLPRERQSVSTDEMFLKLAPRTGFGEKGTEALIGVGSFPLFGKISIRLVRKNIISDGREQRETRRDGRST